jgi:hypothetical protein
MTLDRLRELAGDVRSQHPAYCKQRTWKKLFAPHASPLSEAEAQELYALLPPCWCCKDDQ